MTTIIYTKEENKNANPNLEMPQMRIHMASKNRQPKRMPTMQKPKLEQTKRETKSATNNER